MSLTAPERGMQPAHEAILVVIGKVPVDDPIHAPTAGALSATQRARRRRRRSRRRSRRSSSRRRRRTLSSGHAIDAGAGVARARRPQDPDEDLDVRVEDVSPAECPALRGAARPEDDSVEQVHVV